MVQFTQLLSYIKERWFCGICSEFPCERLTSVIHWNPDIVEHLSALAKQYHEQEG